MPSSKAQSRLIKRTYRQCGLDPRKPSDRPHFFEAHGTGTPAGDPAEAEAIYAAFFDDDRVTRNGIKPPNRIPYTTGIHNTHEEPCAYTAAASKYPLYIGSIKTIIGHLEGCAGLAGLLKSSLALAHSTIPGNMLFERLNPSIKPFCNNIEIPTSTLPWPSVPKGSPRRASTNSFGFGGKLSRVSEQILTHWKSIPPLRSVNTIMLTSSRFQLPLYTRKLRGSNRNFITGDDKALLFTISVLCKF